MRNKLKNLTAITLALALGLAVVGCGGSAAEAPASAAQQAPGAPAAPQSATRAPAQAQLAPAAPAPAMAAPQAQRPMPAAAPTSAPAASSESNENIVEVEIQKLVVQAAPAPAAPASQAPQTTSGGAALMQGGQNQGGQVAQSQSGVGPRGGQPGATTFEDYERTPFVYTSEDSVSTFSLDTDRTSYHLALNWARAGYDVEPDSVRSEEWINAFTCPCCTTTTRSRRGMIASRCIPI